MKSFRKMVLVPFEHHRQQIVDEKITETVDETNDQKKMMVSDILLWIDEKEKGKEILEFIVNRCRNISWTDDGRVSIRGNVVEHSNIVQFTRVATVRKKGNSPDYFKHAVNLYHLQGIEAALFEDIESAENWLLSE